MLSVLKVFRNLILEIMKMDFEACGVLINSTASQCTSDNSCDSCFKEGRMVSVTEIS